MAKFSVKKALAIAGALTVLGTGVFLGIDAASDDFNVVFYPDPIVNPIPTPDPDPTPIPDPDPQPGLIQLATPEMAYNQEDNILTWEEVENASGYLLNVNGVEETTTQTQAVLDIGQNEQYKISLKALGDGEKYSDSEMATLSGVRQNLDQMYYEQIEDNIYKFFEDYMYAGRNKVEIQDILKNSKKTKVLILAHAYNIGDKYVGEPIINMLKKLDAEPIIAEYFDAKRCVKESLKVSRTLPWSYNRHLLGALELYKDVVDGVILITTYPCGPDSMCDEMIVRHYKDIPILTLTIDAQDATAGIETRLESFIEILYYIRKNNYDQ